MITSMPLIGPIYFFMVGGPNICVGLSSNYYYNFCWLVSSFILGGEINFFFFLSFAVQMVFFMGSNIILGGWVHFFSSLFLDGGLGVGQKKLLRDQINLNFLI